MQSSASRPSLCHQSDEEVHPVSSFPFLTLYLLGLAWRSSVSRQPKRFGDNGAGPGERHTHLLLATCETLWHHHVCDA
ncbi:hypothetical protein SKAU_G00122920 [Synaphobranchus kaupii]|uniref:Uncharacterized protein n=1 Tax=Synaphobranchus kaupii TaxID=118154 RepID=A0A9Q1FNV6_SYNKA|nr:hypothetical protein SKAU_G00122920 [Synaphobranchus kaupii]